MQIQFETFSDFMNMGGYAIFVWSVYAIAVTFLAISFWYALWSLKKIKKQSLSASNNLAQKNSKSQTDAEI